MENDQRVEGDITLPCFRNCGAEIYWQNMEDHLEVCPLGLVECGWCHLRVSRNAFDEHVTLENPERRINREQQCMQRQCTDLSKQQKEFSTHIQKLDKEFHSTLQQYITWKSLIAYTVLMLIINLICYHYWLQSQQATHNYEILSKQINALKLLVDNHTNEIHFLQDTDLGANKVKYETFGNHHSFTSKQNSYQDDVDIEWISGDIERLKLTVSRLNKSIGNAISHWQRWTEKAEENFTKVTDLFSEINSTTAYTLTDLRLQVEHQLNLITKLNQSMLTETKLLMENEGNFTRKTDLKSEVADQITKLNKSILNDIKQQLKEMEEESVSTLVAINMSVVNDQLKSINQSILNESKQRLKELKEFNETFTKKIANFSSELHALSLIKVNNSNVAMDKGIHYSQPADSVYEHQNFIELKILKQSNIFMFEDYQTLPATFKMSDFSEKVKNTEQCYGSTFLAFSGGYLLFLEVCVSPGNGDCKGTDVSVFLRLIKGPSDDELQQSGHWPLRGTFTVKLLNEISNNIHYSQEIVFSTYTCRECTKRVEDTNVKARRWGHTQFICHNISREDEELYFNVSYIDINPPISCNQTAPVTLNMCNLREKMNNAEKWYSGPFFAFHEGYQMCLKVYTTTGYGKGNEHLSVFIHLMKGPHDDKLQQSGRWPLRGIFTIKLLNQFKNHHYSKKVTFNEHINCDECIQRVAKGDTTIGWGNSKFLSHHDITDYLKDDCLKFEIFYEDTEAYLPDPSSEQITQAYSAGDLLASIWHVIRYIY